MPQTNAPRTTNASTSTAKSGQSVRMGVPSNARAAIRASIVAPTSTATAVPTPSAQSTVSSGRTDFVRRSRRGSRARTPRSYPDEVGGALTRRRNTWNDQPW